ncbi:2Fe-2S iron-sulfur cluster-binding protein [Bythopirellula goksoeyrii]|uniref:3-ketosteroid-9-alpha-hydroxylase reductase subunit n=1 Tax=Bythopirellula goksoeyrii TaxID=1400387 RepID=A0A5B9QDT3_9BACT|nr:2Fe-2S iron-sulfur cluster-binding protein [Bythopirellula goksoeyrii]QEG35800.1 3-ketosteroid-9-alpha-hydroxylase reductase subunit [Bythopirellula goksoeyrii]
MIFKTAIIVLLAASLASSSNAQISPEEHASHHPGQSQGGEPPDAQSSGTPNPGPAGGMGGPGGMMGGGMGGMMEGMMEKMGAPKPKQIYPQLMALPDLPMEQRAAIEQEAHLRMIEGTKLLAQGLDELTRAAPTNHFDAMQSATAKMREGLAQFESGLAAHRAIAEGKAPQNVALQWFKREMNLLPPPGTQHTGFRLWGMTLFHTLLMVVLVLFAVAMIAMYFFKMRRASALLEKLAMAETANGPATEMALPANSPPSNASTASSSSTNAKDAAKSSAAMAADCCDNSEETCPSNEKATDRSDISEGLLPIRKKKLCRLRVARIDQETPDVKTFRLVACHGGGIPFSYLPGQFLTLKLPVGEKPIRRSYTISSSPTQGYYCEITVKREEYGTGSRFLHDQVKVGDTLEVQAPSGKFVFTGKESEDIVLIGGGVGITPMMSVTRALTDMAWNGDIYFIVACHDPEHFIFESKLRRLQERHDNLHIFVAMSRIKEDINGYRKARLSRELLTEWVPSIAAKRIHICGPPAMMDAVKEMLMELDVPPENIHSENFGGEQKPRVRAEQRAKIAETDIAETGGTVTFSKSAKSTEFQPDETILEASERVGVDIDYSCRIGTCGVCIVKLLSGKVSMEVEDGLEPEEKKLGMILSCQAKSTGSVAVEA